MADYILYDASDIPMAQHHHKLHEMGHFVLGHVQEVKTTEDAEQWLRDIFSKSQFRGYSHIYEKDLNEEHEAEYFAYLVEDKIAEAHRLAELTGISEPVNWQIPPFSGDFAKEDS
ncbi:MAG: hypothetical protein Q9P01_12240 [Anaerolineae bacterium]|nr:hypothetical protein [Anaerolineae bacterium]